MAMSNGPVVSRTPVVPLAIPLAILLKNVVEARAILARERRLAVGPSGSNDAARSNVLSAIEAYTAALDAQRLPVPYALRDELRIQRGVCR